MKLYTDAELAQILDKKIFHKIGEVADEMGVECYLVGGYVRDIFLERPTNDIDVVVVGSGIEVAQALQKALGKNEKTGRWRAHLAVYRNFGTAQVKFYDTEVEFVGARDREIYATLTQYSVGDAYDRTGSVFVIPTSKEKSFLDAMHDLRSVPAFHSGDTDYHGLVSTPDYDVPVELMRFFTGFGVRHFNTNRVPGQDWVDSVTYQLNVTPLVEHLEGETWIGE